MKRQRRKDLVRMAYRECAEIIESALGADLGIFSDNDIAKEEADVIEATMRQISDRLYAASDRA